MKHLLTQVMAIPQTTVVCLLRSVPLVVEFTLVMIQTKSTVIAPPRIENLVYIISFNLLNDSS